MDASAIKKLEEETEKLLDKFSKALSAVKSSEDSNVERDEDRRKEGDGKECDKDFRKIMLENAPRHSDNFIIAEKKTW
jgi:predicted Asp-tRNA(Asn)/Glu-tRNA(Gln) amidotransferase subunit C